MFQTVLHCMGLLVAYLSGHGVTDTISSSVIIGLVSYLIYNRYEPVGIITNTALLVAVPSIQQFQLRIYIPNALLRLFVVVIAHWSSLAIFTGIYRLSPFHPLCKFPGPLIAKVSKFWMAYIAIRGDGHEYLRSLHALYGDVVRIGPNELSFNRGDLVEPILAAKLFPKGPYFDTREHSSGIALDGMRDFRAHALRRKPWSKGMNAAAIRGYEHIVSNKTQELIEALSKHAGEMIDLSAWMGYFGFDFMGQIVFGRDFGMVDAATDSVGLSSLIDKGMAALAIISHVPWILPFLKLIPGSGRDIKKLEQFATECVVSRMKETTRTGDLFYYLTGEDSASSVRPSVEMVASDSMLAVVAGSETAATALSIAFFLLMKHPECRNRLREEINAALSNSGELYDFSKQANMPYLNACIKEALRLYPPVISGLQRRVEKGTEGRVLGDWLIPEETQISVHHYSLHRDPREFYPIPNTYWPDRWLDQDKYILPTGHVIERNQVITHKSSFLSFSAGPQNCVGKTLAVTEMRAVLCAVVHSFDIELAPGFAPQDWDMQLRDMWLIVRTPLLVRLKLRV